MAMLPRTHNPALDGFIEHAGRTVVGKLLAGMNPRTRQFIDVLSEGLASPSIPGRATTAALNPMAQSGPTGDKARFIAELAARPDGLFIILGRRGSGKTALSLRLAQVFAGTGRHVYVCGMPQTVLTPMAFTAVDKEDVGNVPNGSVVVVDDAALEFSSHSYKGSEALHRLIIESRHRGIALILNYHSSSIADLYALQSTAIFLKPSSSLTDDVQRSGMKQLIARADAAFAQLPRETVNQYAYAASDELGFQGLIRVGLPDGWSDRVSLHHGLRAPAALKAPIKPRASRRAS